MIFGNVLKNATYPISVSSERMSQATAIAKYAEQIGADYLCHGSTGRQVTTRCVSIWCSTSSHRRLK